MSTQVFSRFQASVFCETPSVYRAGRLWRPVDGELSSVDLGTTRAIFSVPSDASNVEVRKLENGVFDVKGVTESGYFETMACSTSEIRDGDEGLGRDLERKLGDLSEEFDVEVVVTRDAVYSKGDEARSAEGLFVHLIGLVSHVSAAEPHLASLIDLFDSARPGVAPRFVECFDLDAHSQLPLVIGVDMANLRHISATYKTDVRFPSLILPFESGNGDHFKTQIHLSGEIHSLVLSARDTLMETVEKSRSSIYYHKLGNVSPGKLLFIQKYYASEITRLMIKYRSFIRVTDSRIEFQSPCLTLLNTVIKVFTINILHQVMEVQVTLENGFTFTDEMIRLIISNDNDGPLIAMKIPSHENQLLLIGNHSNLKGNSTTSRLMTTKNNDIIHHLAKILTALPPDALKQLRAIFELHSDYEEFISGKKNGKVTRIMESVPCLIKLEKLEDDDNLFLILIADSLEEFSDTFAMVINELPAEESFFVPEVYHRPVIGAGGSIIQAIMKRYNVFVRFSNTFFLPQSDLSHTRYDNVIIRCPFKNVSTISEAKRELNLLAREYGDSQPRTFIRFSPGQYRFMLASASHKGVQMIGEIEKTYNVYILFPFEEPAENSLLEIRGNADNSMQAAKELIKTCFGIEREIRVNKSLESSSDFYNSIVANFQQTMNIEVTFSNNVVRVTYEQGNPSITKAMDILTNALNERGLRILSKDVIVDFIAPNNHDPYDPGFNSGASVSAAKPKFKAAESYQSMMSNGIVSGRYAPPQAQIRRPVDGQRGTSIRITDNRNVGKQSFPVYNERHLPNA